MNVITKVADTLVTGDVVFIIDRFFYVGGIDSNGGNVWLDLYWDEERTNLKEQYPLGESALVAVAEAV